MKQYNVIAIMLDSLRQDHLGCYGNTRVRTPNIDQLARESVIFDNAYPEGLPTIPVRTALFTGQRTLPYRPWQPLEKEDITAAEIFSALGYTCALITDTYHLAKPGMNFHKGFHSFDWIRGQEGDPYITAPHGKDLEDYIKPAMYGDRVVGLIDQYLRNTAGRKGEEDYFCAQVMRKAMDWIENNAKVNQPFFLWVDSFDPHEPWDPPSRYDTYTDPNYSGKKLIHPKYGPVDWMTQEELEYVRGLYAGEVAFVDTWTGHFLDKIRELGLMENTLIVLLADHGHPHGDHGSIMKTDNNLYSELLRIPLMIRHPEGLYAGKHVHPLVETDDVLPTILDILGLGHETISMHGKSAWRLVTGEASKLRDVVITGYHESRHRCVRDEEWSYISRPDPEDDELYHLTEDPKEKVNVIDRYPEKAEELRRHLGVYFRPRLPRILSIQLRYEVQHTPAGK
ncbi:MAG TPA: sulfatase-like hydrolase/transferase [Firmicutes bacterium]|nr:sulfatase-like hydrolase/transferase [Bacillota bacterium]